MTEQLECPSCGESITRTLLKYLPRKGINGKTWKRAIYVDQSGRQMNGRECADCKLGTEKEATK